MRPTTYFTDTSILGHYAVAQRSGTVTAMGAGEEFASIRWTSSTSFLQLMRIRCGVTILSAVTTALALDVAAKIVRGFTVDFTTASTAATMSVPPGTGAMRKNMSTSQMGVNGPRISTTVTMTGETFTKDAHPFAVASWPTITAVNATGTAVALPAGAGTGMATLYEWTGLGQHPVVLSQNEGVVLEPITGGPATGTWAYYVEWIWGEVPAP
jgi:hypothetical protein